MRVIAATFGLLLYVLLSGASAQAPSSLPIVVLPAPDGPIRMELDLRVDRQSPNVAWDQFLNRFFDFFDRDGDGMLNEAECQRLPRLPLPEKRELGLVFSTLDRDNDRRVIRSELIACCSERGYCPIVVRQETPSAEDVLLSNVFQQWFDENHDGKLTVDELRRAARTMSRYDLDEDGAISFEELLGSSTAQSPEENTVPGSQSNVPTRTVRLEISLGETTSSVVVDTDARHVMTLSGNSKNAMRFRGITGPWMLTIDTRRQIPNTKSSGDFLIAQFQNVLGKRADLTLEQIRDDSRLSGLWEFAPIADRNTDQLLSLAELQSYSELVAAAMASQIWITMSDQLFNLFSVLDENRDGRLSIIELAQVSEVLGPEGTIQSLPRQIQITLGAAPIRSWGGMMVPALPKRVPVQMKQEPSGPTWFQALDRNRDGIVSAREFVGPPEVFRRLDGDSDGMISLAEATRSVAP